MIAVDVPGAFETFFTGTGCYAGQPYSPNAELERGAVELRAAWGLASTIRRGRGYTIRLELPSVWAALVLAEYAEACLSANSDEPERSEVAAARKVLARVADASGGRVGWNGYYVALDGAPA